MRRSTLDIFRGLACLLLCLVLSTKAPAVVISSGNGQGNTTLPASNPGAGNVAHLSSASAVYLGNRWILTANHVSDSTSLTLADGRSIAIVPNSGITLNNPIGVTGTPDLRLEQLAQDPGLPSLDIATKSPTTGSYMMMVGNGFDRQANLIGFQLRTTGYVRAPIPVDSLIGHDLASTSHLRWGFNRVESGGIATVLSTQTFHTLFDRASSPNEAQATTGDSGGGVFQFTGGHWQLAGIMIAGQGVSGQPNGTVLYGDQTFIADLATYRDQIEAVLHGPTAQPTASALASVNPLTAAGAVVDAHPSSLTADALSAVAEATSARNMLLTPDSSATSLTALPFVVPEPSSLILAAAGAALAVVARCASRRRAAARSAR